MCDQEILDICDEEVLRHDRKGGHALTFAIRRRVVAGLLPEVAPELTPEDSEAYMELESMADTANLLRETLLLSGNNGMESLVRAVMSGKADAISELLSKWVKVIGNLAERYDGMPDDFKRVYYDKDLFGQIAEVAKIAEDRFRANANVEEEHPLSLDELSCVFRTIIASRQRLLGMEQHERFCQAFLLRWELATGFVAAILPDLSEVKPC